MKVSEIISAEEARAEVFLYNRRFINSNLEKIDKAIRTAAQIGLTSWTFFYQASDKENILSISEILRKCCGYEVKISNPSSSLEPLGDIVLEVSWEKEE